MGGEADFLHLARSERKSHGSPCPLLTSPMGEGPPPLLLLKNGERRSPVAHRRAALPPLRRASCTSSPPCSCAVERYFAFRCEWRPAKRVWAQFNKGVAMRKSWWFTAGLVLALATAAPAAERA